MRLDKTEMLALNKALEQISSPVFIFGSRIDDRKKGGDIDVLIFSSEDPLALSMKVARDFFTRCESKIDVVIVNPDAVSLTEKAFLNTLRMERFK